eukprot:7116333-Prymnesium_polylepis.1
MCKAWVTRAAAAAQRSLGPWGEKEERRNLLPAWRGIRARVTPPSRGSGSTRGSVAWLIRSWDGVVVRSGVCENRV